MARSRLIRQAYKDFGDAVRPIIRLMDDVDNAAPAALKSTLLLCKHEAMQAAAVILLSGYFESFLRNAAENFFEDIKGRSVSYSSLPDSMKIQHFVSGAATIAKIAEQERRDRSSDFKETVAAAKALTLPVSANNSQLFWRAFAETKGNPGPQVLKDYLRNFEICDPVRSLGNTIGYSDKHIESTLQTFINLRNECAHTGSIKNVPSTSSIRNYATFLRRLCYGVAKLMSDSLSKL